MGLESATFINGLNTANPVGAVDAKNQGDDHLRLIKSTIKNTFPNITGAVTLTHTEINDAARKAVANTFSEPQVISKAANGDVLHLINTGSTAVNGAVLELQSASPGIIFHDTTGSAFSAILSVNGNVMSVLPSTDDGASVGSSVFDINLQTGDVTITGEIEVSSFGSGTRIIFQQTAAPTGWTKDSTHNNKALRLVNGTVGSGGSLNFTSAFASRDVQGTISNTTISGTVQNHTLTTSQIPSHNHTVTVSGTTDTVGNHTHELASAGSGGTRARSANSTSTGGGGGDSVGAGSHNHTVSASGTSDVAGGGQAHTHDFQGDSHNHSFTGTSINLAVQYVDCIIAQKD